MLTFEDDVTPAPQPRMQPATPEPSRAIGRGAHARDAAPPTEAEHPASDTSFRRVRIEDIQRIVARHYNVSRQELVSNRRTRVIVKPRQIAMYLSKTLTPRSFPEIGRRFGGRDHTTVLHAVRTVGDDCKNEPEVASQLTYLEAQLTA